MNNLDQTDIMIQILLKAAGVVEELKRQTTALNQLTQAADKAKAAVVGVGGVGKATATQLNSTSTSAQKVATNVEKIEPATKKAGKGLWSMTNMARTALGTLEAMAIFLVTRFIGQAITKSIDSIRQLELAMYKLGTAEKSLSDFGVNITQQDLIDISKRLTDVFSYISDIDATKAVSNLALLTKELKLSKEQIEGLAKSAAVLAFRKDITLESAIDQLVTGITTSGRGLKDLGIPVDALVIKEEALNSKLVESEEAWKNLSGAERQEIEVAAILQIITRNTADELKNQAEINGTVVKTTRDVTAEWENLTTLMGSTLKPLLVTGGTALVFYLEIWQAGFKGLGVLIAETIYLFTALSAVVKASMAGNIKSVDDLKSVLAKNRDEMIPLIYSQIFPTGDTSATIGGMTTDFNIFGRKLANFKDTPTGNSLNQLSEDLGEAAEDVAKAIEDAKKKIDDALADLEFDKAEALIELEYKIGTATDIGDIQRELNDKLEDAERDFKEKVADINQKYSEKVSDINRDSSERRQDAIRKSHEDEINEERDFQNKLLALKEDFLMDLDDALHARDARQVLRLIRQYNLDKTRLIRERADKKAENAADLAQNLSEINKDRERRLADAARERKQDLANAKRDYAEKRAELKLNAEREREDARRDYDRKLADLQRHFNEKMQALLRSIIQEGKLTAAGAKMVYDALNAYRPGGAIWNTWANYLKYVQAIQAAAAGASSATPSSDDYAIRHPGTAGSYRPTISGSGGRPFSPMAEGGTLLANRPTTVTFGEAGLEMAKFTPIGRRGRDTNKIFSNLGGGAGMGGNLKLQVVMSEGLVASIVDTSLKNVTSVIETVRRERR